VIVGSRVFISAGEASGDLYAAGVAEALKRRRPGVKFFGCAGPSMRRAGVRAVADSASLAVVGLIEVLRHLPRIYGEYRKLVREIRREPPEAAILTDSPDFHLRLAVQLKRMGVPVIYLVAPQVWAWRRGRLRRMRNVIDRLLCIFPFEEEFFARSGMNAAYIGHPLTRLIRPSASPAVLRREFAPADAGPLIALLPGSRPGEALRHLPALLDACERLQAQRKARFILSLPEGFQARASLESFRERFSRLTIQVLEGRTWDVLACADLALAASGTVTIEAALLGAPMITFYRVNRMSWLIGKLLVRVPFYSMVNLIAGRRVVPELIQNQMTGERLAAEAGELLDDENGRARMRTDLAMVARRLAADADPLETAASVVEMFLKEEMAHV
jgi:lipid-A-disaccharide synthase